MRCVEHRGGDVLCICGMMVGVICERSLGYEPDDKIIPVVFASSGGVQSFDSFDVAYEEFDF